MATAMVTEMTPAISEARAPERTRASTSRPSSSVPNQCNPLGGLRTVVHDVPIGSQPAQGRPGQREQDEQPDQVSPMAAERCAGACPRSGSSARGFLFRRVQRDGHQRVFRRGLSTT